MKVWRRKGEQRTLLFLFSLLAVLPIILIAIMIAIYIGIVVLVILIFIIFVLINVMLIDALFCISKFTSVSCSKPLLCHVQYLWTSFDRCQWHCPICYRYRWCRFIYRCGLCQIITFAMLFIFIPITITIMI